MKTQNLKIQLLILILIFGVNSASIAQVGIGTTTPDASSMLDINSTTKGLLAPRMTTAQKNAIVSPTNGLLVYDTDFGKFYYYTGTAWVAMDSNIGRDNYVLVKTAADFPAPIAGLITLDTGIMYEINGTIILSNKIELNESEIIGQDSNNDKLVFTGTGALFTGVKGGIVKNLTLAGNGANTLLSLNDATQTLNLIFRDNNIANFLSVGSISGYNLVLLHLANFSGNSSGITFTNNAKLILIDQAWFANNGGTFTTLVGAFDVIGIQGGVCDVSSGATALNVTGVTAVNKDAILSGISYSGAGTMTVGTFSKEWEIESSGIPTLRDDSATGTIYITSPALTVIPGTNTPVKAAGTTTAENLFRFDTDGGTNNRLKYTGTKTRKFTVIASVSITSPYNGQIISLYIAKNGAAVGSTRIIRKISNGADVGAAAITGIVELVPGDYVEFWMGNDSSNKDATIEAMNFIIK